MSEFVFFLYQNLKICYGIVVETFEERITLRSVVYLKKGFD
jgi:hypothetical protein